MPRKTLRRQKKVCTTRKNRTNQKNQKNQKNRSAKKRTYRRYKGGNYAVNITTKEVDGIPVTKDALITVPGRGTMSVKAFQQLKEDLDRNGDDIYD